MHNAIPEPAQDKWTLIRNARQLLTLGGTPGLRSGPVELNIIPNGAVLIKNRLIEEVGPTSRLENVAAAKGAIEIDASRKVVMPAFIDADFPLVVPVPIGGNYDGALRKMARERMQANASSMASECIRYGCLTIGAHTAYARDLTSVKKVLRTHRKLTKSIRIRSIFSPCLRIHSLDTLTSKWLPAVRKADLASVVEFALEGAEQPGDFTLIREAATAAASLGFSIRLRSACRPDPAFLQLALSAGAISIVSPHDGLRAFIGPLATVGCVRVLPASACFDHNRRRRAGRPPGDR